MKYLTETTIEKQFKCYGSLPFAWSVGSKYRQRFLDHETKVADA